MTQNEFPTYETLMNPTLIALKELGGSATIEELYNKVVEIADTPDEQLEVLHDPEKGGRTEVEYRLAWTRTYLKIYEAIENSSRVVWSLTSKGRQIKLAHYIDLHKKYLGSMPDDLELFIRQEADAPLSIKTELLKDLKKKGWKPTEIPDPTLLKRMVKK